MNTPHNPTQDALAALLSCDDVETLHRVSGLNPEHALFKYMARMLEARNALVKLQLELQAHVKFDVKKHYSLMVANAAAAKAIAQASQA